MADSLDEIIGRYQADAPLARASTIPAAWYLDPRVLELEHRTVFSRSWQMAGRLDELRAPGDYVTCELPGGEPIVVARGADSRLRAFFNVCRHHAAAVVTDVHGCVQQFRCPLPRVDVRSRWCAERDARLRRGVRLRPLGARTRSPRVCGWPRNGRSSDPSAMARRWRRSSGPPCPAISPRVVSTRCTGSSVAITRSTATGRCSWTTTSMAGITCRTCIGDSTASSARANTRSRSASVSASSGARS